jgi:hypothetical protein
MRVQSPLNTRAWRRRRLHVIIGIASIVWIGSTSSAGCRDRRETPHAVGSGYGVGRPAPAVTIDGVDDPLQRGEGKSKGLEAGDEERRRGAVLPRDAGATDAAGGDAR